MYRKIDNHKSTASFHKGIITFTYDDGWEEILDCRVTCKSDTEALAYLVAAGYEEYDPNAELKALGFVWDRACYSKPKN